MLPCRLDEVVDAGKITSTLLDIMPKCSKQVQQGILELLPELVLEEDCQVQPCPMLNHIMCDVVPTAYEALSRLGQHV